MLVTLFLTKQVRQLLNTPSDAFSIPHILYSLLEITRELFS